MNLTDEHKKWAAYVSEHAAPHGLELECLDIFYHVLNSNMGEKPAEAAEHALYDWDI